MTVHVRLFALARDLTGVGELKIELPANATVKDVRRSLCESRPALREMLERCAIAVDEDFAADDVIVTDKSEIAVIPPVSGG
jgi:molybdopterin converting factor subunit 1